MPGKPGDPGNARYLALSASDRTGEGYAASYNTWNSLVTTEGRDLVVANQTDIVEAFPDFGPSGLVESIVTNIGSFYTNADAANFLWLRPVVGAEVFNPANTIGDYTSHFHIASGGNDLFTTTPDYMRITDISCFSSSVTIETPNICTISENLIQNDVGKPTININFGSGSFRNNVVISNLASSNRECINNHRSSGNPVEISNNLLISNSNNASFICLESSRNGAEINNNVAVLLVPGGLCYVVSGHSEFISNASSDASANDPAGGIGNIINIDHTIEIEDLLGNDFHVRAGSQFIGAATELSALFQIDFEADPRPTDGSNWTIGVDEPAITPTVGILNSIIHSQEF